MTIPSGFLLAMGVDAATAAQDSEGIEHLISKPTLEAMKRILARGGTQHEWLLIS